MAGKSAVPVKTRITAWLCSAVIGVAFYLIFLKVFVGLGIGEGWPEYWLHMWKSLPMVIGIVAGTGSFALIFANWFMTARAEVKPSAAPTKPAMHQPEEEEKPTEEMPSSPPEESNAGQPETPSEEKPE